MPYETVRHGFGRGRGVPSPDHAGRGVWRTPDLIAGRGNPPMRRSSNRFPWRALLALTCVPTLSLSAGADTVLTSNMGQPKQAYSGFTNASWTAAPFQTTASLTRITEISLGIFNAGSYSGGNFFVEIHDAAAGNTGPGAMSWPVYAGSFTASPMTFTGLSVDLSPSTEYFVVVGGTTLQTYFDGEDYVDGSLGWGVLYEPSVHSGDGFVVGTWFGSGFSSPWRQSTSYTPRMSITATSGTPVPEIDPAAAVSVVSLVAGALALLDRRRRA